jgi:hypothetical protein
MAFLLVRRLVVLLYNGENIEDIDEAIKPTKLPPYMLLLSNRQGSIKPRFKCVQPNLVE